MKAIHVSELDNVATALEPLQQGESALGVTLRQDIPKGHKFATADIDKGRPVIKYASHIGVASTAIRAGEWVHVHNLEGERGRGDTDTAVRNISQDGHRCAAAQSNRSYSLQVYRRSDGSFGFRNRVLVIPSVHCANKVVERIAQKAAHKDDSGDCESNIVYVTHQHGCSELDYDARQTMETLVGTGANPNVYGVLVVGLGCEGVPARSIAEAIKERAPYKKVDYLIIQETGGTMKSVEKGTAIVQSLLEEARQVPKSEGTLADVILGTECGGSDSFSGLSANPSLGAASDIVIQHGGSVILAETTELIGAEHILAGRTPDPSLKQSILDTIKGYENAVIQSHADIRGANPSPGNIEGGLSSIEEKSLGCIYKAGNYPVAAVKAYA